MNRYCEFYYEIFAAVNIITFSTKKEETRFSNAQSIWFFPKFKN